MSGGGRFVETVVGATHRGPRVLIIAENASEKFGGEAVLPFQYFKLLRERGVDVWLVTHSRVREELQEKFPDDVDRLHFVEDSRLHRRLWRAGRNLQPRLRYITHDLLLRFVTQRAQLRLARTLVRQHDIDVVHQPTPVSPREPSTIANLGAPVVIGPMNCAVDYPRAFRGLEFAVTRTLVAMGRASAPLLNLVFQGKRKAALLIVANERSRDAIGAGRHARVELLPENGIDLDKWQLHRSRDPSTHGCRFVFVGRLIQSKGADLFIRAFEGLLARGHGEVSALIIGDGPELPRLRRQAEDAGLLAEHLNQPGRIFFSGWQTHSEVADLFATQDCLVFPTLLECGGAVVLEAMAMEMPVIASGWGGPADYLDSSCGILISEESPSLFVSRLVDSMASIASDPDLRESMGRAGRLKIEQCYTWDSKIDRMLDLYQVAIAHAAGEDAVPHASPRVGCISGSAMLLCDGDCKEFG